MEILERKQLDSMTLFIEYISKIACPTSFAIASGLISFINKEHMVCSSYFVNDTNEIEYSQIMKVTDLGIYSYASKIDKYIAGIRPALLSSELNSSLILDGMEVNRDLSVIEYGHYPKSLMRKQYIKEDTGTKIKLPISDRALSKSEYKEFVVYKNPNTGEYFIEYPIYGMCTRIENEMFNYGQTATFKIEPVRFWVDNNSGLCITQDIIQGGVSYKMFDEFEYTYDDYYDSDLCEAVSIIKEDMVILTKLISEPSKEKKKRKK